MADATFSQLSSVSWDTTAYNALAYFPLRDQLVIDRLATVKPTNQTHPGTSVTFTFVGDLSAATTPLNETTDVTAVLLSDSTINVALAEYGNAVVTSANLRLTSYVEVDPVVANVVGYNAGLSMDTIACAELIGGTNVIYATGGSSTPTTPGTIQVEDVVAGDDIRRAVTELRSGNSMTWGNSYFGIMHPDVSYDLRGQVGTSQWRDVHTYSSPEGIMTGEVGMFEGARILELSRASLVSANAGDGSGGAGTIDRYSTVIVGQECLAKAYAQREGYGPDPQVVLGPVTDRLRRFVPVGWKHFVGYKRFREASIWRIDSASSIGTNA